MSSSSCGQGIAPRICTLPQHITWRYLPAVLLGLSFGTSLHAADDDAVENRTANPPTTLAPITITAGRDALPPAYVGGAVARGAGLGMLGQQDFMETPFSTTAYTEDYMRNTQSTDIGGVLGRADASIYTAQRRGIMETFMIRGFSVWGFRDIYFNGLAGMAPIMRGSTEMAERIEVQKGPSASLSGMAPDGSVGGRINLVAKRAGDVPLTRLNATYESDSLLGVHADVGRRFGMQQQFGIRFNGVLRDGDTAVDDQQHQMGLGALALDWRGDAWRVSVDAYRQRERIDGVNYFAINGIDAAVTRVPSALDGSNNLAPPWAFNINTTQVAMARVEWDLTHTTTAWASYGSNQSSYNARVTGSRLLDDAGTLVSSITRQHYHQRIHSGEAGLQGAFATGTIEHAWSLAVTRYSNRWGVYRAVAPPRTSNLYALDHGAAPDFIGFPSGKPPVTSEMRQNGVALADRIAFSDDRVVVTLGVRRQSIQVKPRTPTPGYEASAWSPTFALLIKPLAHLSVYASYIQGLSQGGTAPATAANAFETLEPYKTEQYELGAKADWGQFGTTVALFQTSLPSAYTDPVTNFYAATGEQRNRGIEMNVFGEPASGLRLMGSASWIAADLRKQLDPAVNGKQAAGVPKFITRLGVEYDLPAVHGLALTGHINHVGKRWFTTDNRLSASAYTTLDVGARYSTRIAGKSVTLRANVTNLLNRKYWAGSAGQGLGYLGTPRTFMLSSSIDF